MRHCAPNMYSDVEKILFSYLICNLLSTALSNILYISALTCNLQTSRLVGVANANVVRCVGLSKKLYKSTKF